MRCRLLYLLLWVILTLTSIPVAVAQSFQLPRPPAGLKGVPARAGWLVEHYWDRADMEALAQGAADAQAQASEGSGPANPSELEQAFVNYVALFPLTESDSLCNAAVASMVRKADTAMATSRIFSLAGKYLYDLDSPMANEEHFLFFVNAFEGSGVLDSAQKSECAYWRRVIDNNRVGHQIEEFSFETAQGKLMDFADVQGERLLLLFDIECEDCRAMIESLRDETRQVVAIAVNTNRKAFRKFAQTLPAGWITGWDSAGTINGGAFALRHLPELMQIAPDGTVLGKHLKK